MNCHNSTLTIIQLNVNSLISLKKRHEMDVFLNRVKPHIVLLNETKIRPKHQIQFRNYTFLRNDRLDNNGGGTGILIKQGIAHTVIPAPTSIRSLETSIIEITSVNKSILIVAAYFTPNTNYSSLNTQDLTELLKLKTHPNSYIVIGGDLNAKHTSWGNGTSNFSGNKLFNWLNTNCLTQNIKILCSDLPSYNSLDTNSYLDIFLISDNITVHHDQHSYPNLKSIDFESDHQAIELKISLNFTIPRQPPKQISNFSLVNWQILNNYLDKQLTSFDIPVDRILYKEEIDDILIKLRAIIDNTLQKYVPLTTLNYSTQIPLPHNIIKFINFKNSLRRQLYRNRYSPSAHTLKSQINNANSIIKQLIHIHYENHWMTKLSSIKVNNSTFKEINRLTKRKNYQNIPSLTNPITSKKIDQVQDKANLLGQIYEEVHTQNNSLGHDWFTNLINDQVFKYIEIHNAPLITLSSTNQITNNKYCQNNINHQSLAKPSQIKAYIKTRNNKKSAGIDKIPNYALKKLSSKFVEILTIIINHCYNIGYFPNPWKLAIIAPVHKKHKTPNLPTSYRPISLLSNISKIYEKFLLEKIQDHCDENKLIPVNQFGFRASHSTIHAAVILKSDITIKLNQKTPTVACLLDVEKAFDTVWIEGLIFKLIKFKFDPHIIRAIYSFLSDRTFQVKVDNTLSQSFNILAGVPQGSLLGPILYTLYTSDIPPPPILPQPIKSLSYADDIIIYTSKRNIMKAADDLNNYLNQLSAYFNKWKIKINNAKCEAITFKGCKVLTKKQNQNCNNIQLQINNTIIQKKKEIKYLGITLSEDIKPYKHIKSIIQKALISYNSIKSVLHYKSHLQKRIKLICYKQLIRPILTYGFPAWSDLSSSQMEKLRRLERKIIRSCSNIYRKPDSYKYINNSTLYKKTNISRIDRYMISNCIKFFENAEHSRNPLIRNSINSEEATVYEEVKYSPPYIIKNLHETNQLYNNNNELTYYHRSLRPTIQHLVYNINQ